MKTAIFKVTIFVLCSFSASLTFAQIAGSISSQAVPVQVADHPQHAEQHDMARPQNIYEHSDYAWEKGERPLWEFGPIATAVPLGDTARLLRKQHAQAKRADIIWENF